MRVFAVLTGVTLGFLAGAVWIGDLQAVLLLAPTAWLALTVHLKNQEESF